MYAPFKRRKGSSWCSDESVAEFLPLPCDDSKVWKAMNRAWERFEERARGDSVRELLSDDRAVAMSEMIGSYVRAVNPRHGFNGIATMFKLYPETRPHFLLKTLPFIVKQAQALVDRLVVNSSAPPTPLSTSSPHSDWTASVKTDTRERRRLRMLKFAKEKSEAVQVVVMDRALVLSLLSNAFLGTIAPDYVQGLPLPHAHYDRSLPDPRILRLLEANGPQEVAKLRMLVNYFDRCREEMPRGTITIYRHRSELGDAETWACSQTPLLPMAVERLGMGFEDAANKRLVHADFANMYIGGGVLGGGCVQEEIRFAICPENLASLLLCPNMRDDEALQIIGAEQFSQYRGYSMGLKYGGDFKDETPRDPDGTVLTALACMDALDFRLTGGADLTTQLQPALMLREANKAFAAFYPCNKRTGDMPIATGNWGAGAFLGCAELKALLQWAAASQAHRYLVYFPFDWDKGQFSVDLRELSNACTGEGYRPITVGELWRALEAIRARRVHPHLLFEEVWKWLSEDLPER
uniref:poly(ADP-ribose) glycohydrolase n=1 Tax=Alexandrium catenella TaxID=2925 RepID=A0A7S1MC95_ALECA